MNRKKLAGIIAGGVLVVGICTSIILGVFNTGDKTKNETATGTNNGYSESEVAKDDKKETKLEDKKDVKPEEKKETKAEPKKDEKKESKPTSSTSKDVKASVNNDLKSIDVKVPSKDKVQPKRVVRSSSRTTGSKPVSKPVVRKTSTGTTARRKTSTVSKKTTSKATTSKATSPKRTTSKPKKQTPTGGSYAPYTGFSYSSSKYGRESNVDMCAHNEMSSRASSTVSFPDASKIANAFVKGADVGRVKSALVGKLYNNRYVITDVRVSRYSAPLFKSNGAGVSDSEQYRIMDSKGLTSTPGGLYAYGAGLYAPVTDQTYVHSVKVIITFKKI